MFILSMACAMLKNVYLGIRVLVCELIWLARDQSMHSQMQRLTTEQHDLQCRISELTVLADPARRQAEGDLSLLEADMATLTGERAAKHQRHLQKFLAVR